MIGFKQLNTRERYAMIGNANTVLGANTDTLAKIFGVCPKTVRTSIEYCHNHWPIPPLGRPNSLSPHHLVFIESKVINNRNITCKNLVMY